MNNMNWKTHDLHYVGLVKPLFALALASVVFASCGKKQEPEQTVEEIERAIVQQARDEREEIIRMSDFKENGSCQKNGHSYAYTIARTACDSLGIVLDSDGYRTVDNAIQLYITCDGALMFNKTFTRRAFKIGISDESFQHYVLSNMVFSRMTTSGLQFDVTLCEGSDEDYYMQFALTVAPDGSTNIAPLDVFEDDEIDRFE